MALCAILSPMQLMNYECLGKIFIFMLSLKGTCIIWFEWNCSSLFFSQIKVEIILISQVGEDGCQKRMSHICDSKIPVL